MYRYPTLRCVRYGPRYLTQMYIRYGPRYLTEVLGAIGTPVNTYPGFGNTHRIDEIPGFRYELGDDLNTLPRC